MRASGLSTQPQLNFSISHHWIQFYFYDAILKLTELSKHYVSQKMTIGKGGVIDGQILPSKLMAIDKKGDNFLYLIWFSLIRSHKQILYFYKFFMY